ncbi:MAG: hypothetical protein D6814_05335, partial [Calditrichaeota bacterium]
MQKAVKYCYSLVIGLCSVALLASLSVAQTLIADPPAEGPPGTWTYSYNVFNTTSTPVTIKKITIEDGPEIPATPVSAPSGWTLFQGPDDKIGWENASGTTIPGNSDFGPFSYKVKRPPRDSNWEIVRSDNSSKTGGPVPSAVPVELLSFSAQAEAGKVILRWATASETENLGFFVYRSDNAEHGFMPIHRDIILGAGNSSRQQNYSWVDETVEPGKTYYYKLADVDYNGNVELHGPISITAGKVPSDYILKQNYPNPFNPRTTIQFTLPEAGEVTLA